MGKKTEEEGIAGQISLFDLWHDNDEMDLHTGEIEEEQGTAPDVSVEETKKPKRKDTPAAMDTTEADTAESEGTEAEKENRDELVPGDIVWSCYGDYEGSRDAKAYIITKAVQKGTYEAREADKEQSTKKLRLTIKSEGIAWARTREEAEKLRL